MFLRNRLFAIFLLATVAPGVSFHAAAAGGLWLATGAGFDPAGLEAWQAATSAPLAGLDAAGPRLRLFLNEGGHDGSARFEAGWSVAAPWFSGAVLGGLEARRQDGWKDGRTRLTPVIATELEAAGGRGGLAASALLRPAFGEAWLEVRPWLDLGNCRRLGAVAAAAPLQHEAPFRVGLFGSGYRIVLPAIRELVLGGELGLAGGRHGRVLNPFAGLNLGFDL